MRCVTVIGGVLVVLFGIVPNVAAEEVAPRAAEQLVPLDEDANVDRAWLAPTAITHDAGTLSVRNRELFVVGMSYSVSDRLQVELDTLVFPVFAGALTVKAQLVRQSGWYVAATASHMLIDQQYTDTNISLFGAAATRCFDPRCAAMASAGLQIGRYAVTGSTDDGGGTSSVPIIASASVVHPVATHWKLIGEVNATITRLSEGDEDSETVMPFVGVRLHAQRFAVDAGVLMSISKSEDLGWRAESGPIAGFAIPWMSASTMWL